jgi:hypothetical protein
MTSATSATAPQVLYRYRPMSETLADEIAFNTVYFCPLKDLNDDLEGAFNFGPSAPEELRNALIEKAFLDNEIEFALLLHLLPDGYLAQIDRDAKAIGEREIAIDKWGVVCFTERLNNQQMWDRYARQGNGVVLEFEISSAAIPPGALWKVNYTEQRGSTSVLHALTSRLDGEFCEALAYKKPKWSYEEEWRLLANRQGVFKIDIPIRRVIVGPTMSDSEKSQIASAMVRNGRLPRLAELVRTSDPKEYLLYDRLAGNQKIILA